MSSYLARIELHDGTPEDYAKLNKSMESIGFSRVIRSDASSVGVYLPTGHYVGTGELSVGQVSQMAQSAALRRFFSTMMSKSAFDFRS